VLELYGFNTLKSTSFYAEKKKNKSIFCPFHRELLTLSHRFLSSAMKEFQLCAFVVMALLTITLLFFISTQSSADNHLKRSRWLMSAGTALMSIQFLFQLLMGFREMGVTQAVMVNLLFFIPCSCLFTQAILNLQQQIQHNGKKAWMPALVAWCLTTVMLVGANLLDGKPLAHKVAERFQRVDRLHDLPG